MTTSDWESLEVFTITSATGTANLYANGRQQAWLRITLRAIDINGQPVALTAGELASLELIDSQNRPIQTDPLDYDQRFTDSLTLARQLYYPTEYDRVATGQVAFNPVRHDRLQFNKYRRDTNGTNWVWSRTRNKNYQFFPRTPGERPPEDETDQAGPHTYVIDVYVRTISTQPLSIAARVEHRDGRKFMSHRPYREKGTLTLNPVNTPNYTARDYNFSRHVVSGNVDSQQHFDSLDYYAFNLNAQYPHVEFLNFEMNPISIRRDAIAPRDRGSISGYTYAGDDYFNYGMTLRSLPNKLVPGFRGRGKVYVCLVRRNQMPQVPGTVNRDPAPSRGPTTIRAQDMFGNDHRVRMQFQGNGRKYLELV